MASPDGSSPQSGGRRDDEAYEEEHVHQVYQQIAEHFSSTRYKAWKRFAFFLFGFRALLAHLLAREYLLTIGTYSPGPLSSGSSRI